MFEENMFPQILITAIRVDCIPLLHSIFSSENTSRIDGFSWSASYRIIRRYKSKSKQACNLYLEDLFSSDVKNVIASDIVSGVRWATVL